LSGLARETRQRLGRRHKADGQPADQNGNRFHRAEEPANAEASIKTVSPHRAASRRSGARIPQRRSMEQYARKRGAQPSGFSNSSCDLARGEAFLQH
jgi:hypothetical protein